MSLWSISGECVAVADPELRFTPSGKAVAKVRVVTNDVKRGEHGGWEKGDPSFLDLVVWERQAEYMAETVKKGDTIVVSGRLAMRTWEADDGTKRTAYEIRVSAPGDHWGVSCRWNAWTKVESQKDSVSSQANDPWGAPADPGAPPF